jgi:hypothetical protein
VVTGVAAEAERAPLDEPAHRERPRRPWLLAALVGVALTLGYGAALRYHGLGIPDEFIYLAGAKRLVHDGSLDACFYRTEAILERGYPHQDDHAPGYVLLLGAAFLLLPHTYWGAVALNVAAMAAAAWLVALLGRELGAEQPWVGAALLFVLPTVLAYVFWIMAEVALATLVLAALVAAARLGGRSWGAAAAGVLLGTAFLVRESALFVLPALLTLLPRRRAVALCLGGFLAFGLLVYAPLSVRRAPGGANFWVPTSGRAFGYQSVAAAREGRVSAALSAMGQRASANWKEVVAAPRTEQGFLLIFLALPAVALAGWRRHSPRARRFYAALSLAWLAMVVLLTGVYVLARWSGFRYLMVLMPAFLPALASAARVPRPPVLRWWPPAAVFVAGLALLVSTHRILDPFKATSSSAPALFAYLERHFAGKPPRTVLYFRGYELALADPPIEVIFTLPADQRELRRLENAVWFDYVVLSPGQELRKVLNHRRRYRLVNGDDPTAPVQIYARSAEPQ